MPLPAGMPETPLLRGIAVSVPWFAAVVVAVYRRHPRVIGFLAALVSVVACARLLMAAPAGESLYQALMVLYSCLTLGATLLLPRRDCGPGTIGGILFMLGSTLLAYSAEDLLILLAAWILSTIPFFVPRWFQAITWRPRVGLLLSGLALAAAIALIAADVRTVSIDSLKGRSPGGMAVFGLLVIAVIFRKGILPAHAWVADAAESGPAIPTALLLNGHFGALLVAKLIVPLFPGSTGNLFPLLSYLAIATALYIAVRALTENSPRRLLAFIALSQSAAILAGLESRTEEGITGALVHWFVVTVSTVGLFGILRLLEVRFGENLTSLKHLGLAQHAPRLAVSFAVFGLALVGLPGTLSFCSQDLLIHGTLMSHPLIGLLLPIATAMNAVSVFRLFTRLFLGQRRTGFTVMADALPRERWILAAGVLFVVLGGLFPNVIVAQRSAGTDIVEQAISTPTRSALTESSKIAGSLCGPIPATESGGAGEAGQYIVRTAEKMPEENYGMRPGTQQEVRTFGQQVSHVATYNFLWCSHAKGEKNPSPGNLDKLTSKAEIMKVVNDAFTYCDAVYNALTDASGTQVVDITQENGRQTRNLRMGLLTLNYGHNNEIYGSMVVYLRMKNLVPPASEPRAPNPQQKK